MVTSLDFAILVGYVLWSAASGLSSARKASESLEEYVLAGRSLSGWSAGISMAATQFAADTPLVVTGLVATSGLFALWRLWIYALAFLLLGFVLAGSWRRAGVVTDAELSELRYGGRPAAILRAVKAVHFGIFFNCTVLAMVLLATTRIVEPFSHWDQWLSDGVFESAQAAVRALRLSFATGSGACDSRCTECIRGACFSAPDWILATNNCLSLSVILIVTGLYSTTGGLRAVVRTDLAQFAIAMVASISYAVVLVSRAGGLEALVARVQSIAPETEAGASLLALTPFEADSISYSLLAILGLQWLLQLNADGSGYLAQRTMACKSEHDARLASVVFTVAQVVVRSLVWIPIALALLVLFPPELVGNDAATRESTYVTGIAELLPSGFLGLMLAGMLGALASTLDTHLNWGASYIAHDLYGRFGARLMFGRDAAPREQVIVARISNIALVALALMIVPYLESIQTAWQVSLLLGSGLGVVLVLRWLWWRTTAWAEIAAISASLVLAPLALLLIEDEPQRMFGVAGGATLVAVLVSLCGPPEDSERVRQFFVRARPPGFWGVMDASVAADARARLLSGLAATCGAALAVFGSLIGAASWMLGSPGWVGWSPLWVALNLLLAVSGGGFGWWAARRNTLSNDSLAMASLATDSRTTDSRTTDSRTTKSE